MTHVQRIYSLTLTFITFSCLCLIPLQRIQAQDSAFIDCARFTERDARVACLEAALDAATPPVETQSESPVITPAATAVPVVERATAERPRSAQTPVVPAASEQERISDFGQSQARITSDGENEVLHDSISKLEGGNNLWRITLSSGQIWDQQYPRSYNLRVGDTVTIERRGFGGGYRLSADRLSGFIRVERIDED